MAKTPVDKQNLVVKAEPGSRHNFSMLPHLVLRLGLSSGALELYLNLLAIMGTAPETTMSSFREVARLTGMPRSSTMKHLKELEDAGLVYFETAHKLHYQNQPPVTTLLIRDLWVFNTDLFRKDRERKSLDEIKALLRVLPEVARIGPPEVARFGPLGVAINGPLIKISCGTKKDKKEDTHRHLSRPTGTAPKANSDDGFNIASAFAEESDDGTRGLVRQWFNKLSNGAAWRETRDGLAFVDVIHCRPGVILMGMCWSIAKSPQHRISSFKYCVNAILQYHKDLNDVPDDLLDQMAESEYRKAAYCLRSGKWLVSDFDVAEWQEFKQQTRGATVRHPRQS